MCYAYGKRFVGKETNLVLELREELFSVPYDQVNWNRARNECAKEDLYYPHPFLQVCALRNTLEWCNLHASRRVSPAACLLKGHDGSDRFEGRTDARKFQEGAVWEQASWSTVDDDSYGGAAFTSYGLIALVGAARRHAS
jgi:hypothetical protein